MTKPAAPESDTPRTDAASDGWIGPVPDGVSVDFVRQLERELAQAQARCAELEKALRGVLAEADRDTDAFIFARRILKDRP